MRTAEEEIREIVARETRAWNTKDPDLLLTVFHPDMVWVWPPTNQDHDPALWILPFGRYALNTLLIIFFVEIGTLLSCSLVAFGFAQSRRGLAGGARCLEIRLDRFQE